MATKGIQAFKAKALLAMMFILVLSVKGFSQDPGDNPDGPPPAVPFDNYYYWILIGAGVILAFFVIRRMQKRKVTH